LIEKERGRKRKKREKGRKRSKRNGALKK